MMIDCFIPTGSINAISRQQLTLVTGMSDRQCRRAIQLARKKGIPIISASSGRGYYIAETDKDLEIVLHEYFSKAVDMLKTYYMLKNNMQCEGQEEIEKVREMLV